MVAAKKTLKKEGFEFEAKYSSNILANQITLKIVSICPSTATNLLRLNFRNILLRNSFYVIEIANPITEHLVTTLA